MCVRNNGGQYSVMSSECLWRDSFENVYLSIADFFVCALERYWPQEHGLIIGTSFTKFIENKIW